MNQTLEQTARRKIDINEPEDVWDVEIGDILLAEGRSEFVTTGNRFLNITFRIGVLFRDGEDRIYAAQREFEDGKASGIMNQQLYLRNDTDIFKSACYQIADRILTQAEL